MGSKTRQRKHVLSVDIKDCRVDTFRSGGKGGQNQNKVSTGVRVVHEPSGAIGECRETRSQADNKRTAFKRMAESFAMKQWIFHTLNKQQLDEAINDAMQQGNIRIEVHDIHGNWVDAEDWIMEENKK